MNKNVVLCEPEKQDELYSCFSMLESSLFHVRHRFANNIH